MSNGLLIDEYGNECDEFGDAIGVHKLGTKSSFDGSINVKAYQKIALACKMSVEDVLAYLQEHGKLPSPKKK